MSQLFNNLLILVLSLKIIYEFYIKASTTLKPESTTKAPFQCPTPNGFFKHEVCTMYWHCINGIAYEFNCQKGQAWNDVLKTCDSESLINCPEDKIRNKS